MAFHPGKDSGHRQKLREIVNNPTSPQIDRQRAQEVLNLTSPRKKLDDSSDEEIDDIHGDAIEELINQAQDFLGQFNTADARVCVDEALKLAKTPIHRSAVLDLAAQILIQDTAPPAEILQILNESEMLTPQSSHERLLDLGQFTTDFTSLNHYKSAITLIEQEITKLSKRLQALPKNNNREVAQQRHELNDQIDDLKNVAATAMVAIGELYTTDLCDEQDADRQCGEFLELAMKTDPMNPEAFRNFGNYCFIKHNSTIPRGTNAENDQLRQNAINFSKQSYQILRKCYEQGLDHKIPEFTGRLELGRQLYELECWEEALTVLTMILQEELLVAEIWLLCIVSSYKLAEQLHIQSTTKPANSKQQINLQQQVDSLLSCAAQYCVNCQNVLKQAEDRDPEIIAQLKEYIQLLETKGYTMAKARKELNAGNDDMEPDLDLLDTIESDSDDDDAIPAGMGDN